MKANGLTIGDLVVCKEDNHPYRVTQLSIDSTIGLAIMPNTIHLYDSSLIEPIPLTEEILKANDFQLKEGGINRSRYVLHDKGYVIDVYLMKGYVECFNVEHNYFRNEEYVMDRVHKCGSLVHELQHALRLCGLTELADNFKLQA